ncbi:MAG: FHA domain-containing protein [Planctomycetota bacterium]
MAFLVIEKNELNEEIRSVTLENETIIGREKTNAVFIDDSRISRQHAKIVRETDGSYYIIDLGSRNGTIVNNEKVSRCKLKPKDRIIICKTVLVFNEESPQLKADLPMAQRRHEGLSSEASDKKDLASEIHKLVQDIDTAKDKDYVKPKETVNIINNKTSTKETSGWMKLLVFISFLLFFIAVLFWAKWAGEKLIAHLTESRQAENIPSSPPPK